MKKSWRNAFVIAVGLTLVLAACSSEPDRDESGNITEEGDLDAFSIKVGDCMDDPGLDEIVNVAAVPCTQPHDFEAYALFDVSVADFDEEAVATEADAGCLERFEPYVGAVWDVSALNYNYFTPTQDSWDEGDREIVCLAFDDAGPLEGTVKGSGL